MKIIPRRKSRVQVKLESIESPGKLRWQAFTDNKLAVFGLVVFSIILFAVIFAPLLTPYERDAMDFLNSNLEPNEEHWFGTDDLGRDYLTRILYGGRVSLLIGLIATTISTILAIIVGGSAGYFGGRIDNFLMRFAEIVMSLPFLPLMITISAVTMDIIRPENRMYLVMVLLGLMSWPGLSRMIRGEILSLKEQEFMQATTALGLSTMRKIFVHLIPNTIGYIVVSATFGLAGAIITESVLSYIGLGIVPPVPSWGNLINSARDYYIFTERTWLWILPGLVLFTAVLSINLIGEGLRDAFDPKSRK
ncbi:oligopeptide ABC transporter permease [Vallitalea okinawensis]|uniref:oligopeptide ABC transporter permease n=1 Tax=Vallitalea okinawensis TaxID=2078660 RepID=UPI001FA8BD2D|nr:oligopeptide ABC transporter permease [Vallitalea okinawensis]